MKNQFYFNGHACSEFGLVCSNGGTYNAPERDVTIIEIPGRNGCLTIDNGRWKDAPVVFPCYLRLGFAKQAPVIRAWLNGAAGYKRLEDDAHPDEYRMARHTGPVDFEPIYTDREAEVEISFTCAPQRWLKCGEMPVSFTAAGALINPTGYVAQPLIVVSGTGTGSIVIGGSTVEISEIGGSITIDSEIQRAYSGMTSRDSAISGTFPVLGEGTSAISFSGGVTSVEITPRWWTI